MSGLELAAGQAVSPITGEIIDLTAATTTDLAGMRDQIRDVRDALNEWARALDGEITERVDREGDGGRTARVGDWVVEVAPPRVWETDAKALRDALHSLANEGVLSLAAVDAAVPIKREVVAKRSGLNKLREHADERVREAVAAHDRRVENPSRRVTVKRAA